MLSIYYIYTSSRFNFYSIKLVTLRLYNYNSLEKLIIKRVEKHFIRRLNIAVLDTMSTLIRIYSIYTPHIQCQDISLCTREPTPHDRNIVTKFNHLQHYNATLVWHGN